MRLSKEAFVNHWKHEIAGMVLDAATRKAHGKELSLVIDFLLGKVETRLGQMWESLAPVELKPGEKK